MVCYCKSILNKVKLNKSTIIKGISIENLDTELIIFVSFGCEGK